MSRSPSDRYLTDPVFKSVVDYLYLLVDYAYMTPSELREAVILAVTKYELTHMRPMVFAPGDEFYEEARGYVPKKEKG